MDLAPSFLSFAGAAVPDGRPLDGHPVLVDVAEKRESPLRDFFWRARRGGITWRAVRSGDLKWIGREDKEEGTEEWFFDLAADPGEKTDLKKSRADSVAELKALVKNWEAEVKAER